MDAQQRAQRWASLQRRAAEVQSAVLLGDAVEWLDDLHGRVTELPGQVRRLREQGYRYARGLAERAEALAQAWPQAHARAETLLAQHRRALAAATTATERTLNRARSARTDADFTGAEAELARWERRAEEAVEDVRGAVASFDEQARALAREVDHLLWAVERLQGAGFTLYPDEYLVDACAAQFLLQGDDEGPKGVLYLTDGRLIFERDEELATKKFLFITTEKKRVQEVWFAAPIGAVEVAETRDARGGFLGLGKRELLHLRFTQRVEGHDLAGARLRLLEGADNDAWAAAIGRVKREELTAEVEPAAEAAGEAAPASPRDIPTHCPGCGAPLTTPVVKGMRELTCEFCGLVVRL